MKRNECILISLIYLFTQCAECRHIVYYTTALTAGHICLRSEWDFLPPDRYHTKANTKLDEREERIVIHFQLEKGFC